MYLLIKSLKWQCFAKPLLLLLIISMHSACNHMPKASDSSHMAATIYTELAQYYWQNGYQSIARDRLQLALQQDPTFAPALLLQAQWQ